MHPFPSPGKRSRNITVPFLELVKFSCVQVPYGVSCPEPSWKRIRRTASGSGSAETSSCPCAWDSNSARKIYQLGENNRKTIGKWWFNGILWDFMGFTLWLVVFLEHGFYFSISWESSQLTKSNLFQRGRTTTNHGF